MKPTGQQPTQDELAPSDCAKRAEDGKGGYTSPKGRGWYGMNMRDETDEVTRKPVGRSLTAGFRMMSNDEIIEEEDYED